MSQCTHCKGSGRIKFTVTNLQTKIATPSDTIKCFYCRGTGEITQAQRIAERLHQLRACKCTEHHGFEFSDDGPCRIKPGNCNITKHHYHCPKCGGWNQIG